MSTSRDKIVKTTGRLLEEQGYHATGLNQIIRESSAPRGSLYYYFPRGKDELATEALEQSVDRLARQTERAMDRFASPAKATRAFLDYIADCVESSNYRQGSPLAGVATETATTNEALNLVCRRAFSRLQGVFEIKLVASGFDKTRATELATYIIAAMEGGILLSRTNHSGDPLRRVAIELERMIAAEQSGVNHQNVEEHEESDSDDWSEWQHGERDRAAA
jgi:TetR/AcrR family transcriptional regulator, lmrAB and yxaGH operons repressor